MCSSGTSTSVDGFTSSLVTYLRSPGPARTRPGVDQVFYVQVNDVDSVLHPHGCLLSRSLSRCGCLFVKNDTLPSLADFAGPSWKFIDCVQPVLRFERDPFPSLDRTCSQVLHSTAYLGGCPLTLRLLIVIFSSLTLYTLGFCPHCCLLRPLLGHFQHLKLTSPSEVVVDTSSCS